MALKAVTAPKALTTAVVDAVKERRHKERPRTAAIGFQPRPSPFWARSHPPSRQLAGRLSTRRHPVELKAPHWVEIILKRVRAIVWRDCDLFSKSYRQLRRVPEPRDGIQRLAKIGNYRVGTGALDRNLNCCARRSDGRFWPMADYTRPDWNRSGTGVLRSSANEWGDGIIPRIGAGTARTACLKRHRCN